MYDTYLGLVGVAFMEFGLDGVAFEDICLGAAVLKEVVDPDLLDERLFIK